MDALTRVEQHQVDTPFGPPSSMPEAKLARAAQMAYATLAMVTDYHGWHSRQAVVRAVARRLQSDENAGYTCKRLRGAYEFPRKRVAARTDPHRVAVGTGNANGCHGRVCAGAFGGDF